MSFLLKHLIEYSSIQGRSWKIFPLFVKGQNVKNLGFVGYIISVTTIHVCHCSMKEAIDQMSVAEFQ